jgi:hypothetical protein
VDLPFRQFGLLVEAGRARIPRDGGEDMPIHAGARSFEDIWQRQTRYASLLHKAEDVVHAEVKEREDDKEVLDIADKMTRQSTLWRSHHVAASGILHHMREAKTVAVDLDVSEGLPDWSNPEEAWGYAAEAELPFPITYFDFTTPGGYRPKVALKTHDGERILTLRAALCWTMEDHLAIAPFTWLEDDLGGGGPMDMAHRTDYDSPGALHFGRKIEILGRDNEPVDEPDFISHLRITSDGGVSAPAQVIRTEPIYGQPGWVDLMNNQDAYTGEDAEGLLLAEAAITTAAACRALSVIHALDGTVNIELGEGEPSRPERRRAERAMKKGQRAEISKTVRIHPTRQTESIPNHKPGTREYSHAFYRRGHFAHYPIGTRMADRLAERDHTKLVDHPVKGLCRKIYRKPTIVGRLGPDGAEREPVAKSYVFQKEHQPRR